MSTQSTTELGQSARFIMQVEDQYKTALQQPFGDLDFHYSADAIKTIKNFGITFKDKALMPEFIQAEKVGKNILATREFLDVAIKQDSVIVPQTTREVALEILSGKPNRFASVKLQKSLGRGDFGKVEKVDAGGQVYALKTLFNAQCQKKLNEEYISLITFKHPYIVDVAYLTKGKVYLEFVDGGTLEENLKALTPQETRKVLSQIAEGLSHIHQMGSIHGDIKSDNILLTKDKDVKIADLGLTKRVGQIKGGKKLKWSPDHMPPEYRLGQISPRSAQKIDVWSFGVLIWDMLKKDAVDFDPFESASNTSSSNEADSLDLIQLESQLDSSKKRLVDPCGELEDLMIECLDKDPANRPTIYEIQDRLGKARYSRKERRETHFAD